ncbi:sugar-binding protein [Aquibacillus sediminis]|uniref:sugar-binding protein n=1 Tax=Aquibacillus sediminis TaxID=2574734 RepID=UPI001107E09D|nr:sugar-binding protein [Aquibacillus sediminis]
MRRASVVYVILLSVFIVAVSFSVYFYKQVQFFDSQVEDAVLPDESQSKYHVTLVGQEMNHDYWRLVGQGAEKAESEHNVFVEYVGPKRSNLEEQLKLVDMAIQSNVDGIIVQGLNEQFTDMINQAEKRGIPVITIDTDSKQSSRHAYIGTDNYLAGKLAGEALIEDTNGAATVGIVTGSLDNPHHQQRVQGFKEVVEHAEGIEIIALEESNITRVEAEEKAYKMLLEHENITAFYGTSSYNGMGIVAAAKSLKKQNDMYVITFDAIDENIALLENTDIDAIVEQQPYEMGYQSVQLMLDIIHDRYVQDVYYKQPTIIHRSDLSNWKRQKEGSL